MYITRDKIHKTQLSKLIVLFRYSIPEGNRGKKSTRYLCVLPIYWKDFNVLIIHLSDIIV